MFSNLITGNQFMLLVMVSLNLIHHHVDITMDSTFRAVENEQCRHICDNIGHKTQNEDKQNKYYNTEN